MTETPSQRGKRSRRKGSQFERDLVNWHKERGIPAKRVPLSGAAEGFKGDIVIGPEYKLQAECKLRGNTGFNSIYNWLEKENNDLLFIRQDRKPSLVVMPIELYEKLIKNSLRE